MERPVSVSLYTVAEGEAYAPFAARWWEAVQAMNPAPAQVVVAIGPEDRAGIRDLVGNAATVVEVQGPFSNGHFTAACEAGTQEWAAFCGIDDVMLPDAFKDIPAATEAGADILVGSIVLSSGGVWRGSWNPPAMLRHNTLPAHSPFRRSLYDAVGGFPDIRWSDWGFWLKCAVHGAKPYPATVPQAIFDVGEDRQTMSGVNLDPTVRAEADAEVIALARSL